MTKVIFLDIDGVLNSEVFYLYRNNPVSEEHPLCDLDPYAMELLNKLIQNTGAKVVISSTWRNTNPIEKLRDLFIKVGFTGEIIGVTPRLGRGTVRGNEILQWIEDNASILGVSRSDYKEFVIFDDDSDMLLWQQYNFVKIDGYSGLTPNSCYKAAYILNQHY